MVGRVLKRKMAQQFVLVTELIKRGSTISFDYRIAL